MPVATALFVATTIAIAMTGNVGAITIPTIWSII